MVGQGKQTSAERRRERAAAQAAAAATEARKRRMRVAGGFGIFLLIGAVVAGGIFALVAAFDDDDEDTVAAQASPTPSPAPPGKANCVYIEDTSSPAKDVGVPPALADTEGSYYATLMINKGEVVWELDAANAPCSVNSFVHLAENGFYDDTICHRELNSPGTYVLQCGDPDGTGRGGPGYSFADENLDGASYETGVVAMANAGPNTNGSQFFMMFDDSQFPPAYVPFAKIVSGLEVLTEIAEAGVKVNETTGARDAPKKKVTISKVTISAEPPGDAKAKPAEKESSAESDS